MATRADLMRLEIPVDTKQGTAAIKNLTREAKRSADTMTESGKRASGSYAALNSRLVSLRTTLLKVSFAAGVTVVAIDRLAKRAETVRRVASAFDTLTTRVNITSAAMLGGLQRATRGTVSDMELMRQANNALLLGLPVTAASMEQLADSAVKLGAAVGLDAASSIESIITGIGRQSRLMLDNLGIIIDTQKAYENYAISLGKTTEELTDQDRKLAFYNATVEAATEKTRGLTLEVNDAASSWRILTTDITNAADALAGFFSKQRSGLGSGIVGGDLAAGPAGELTRLAGQSGFPSTAAGIRDRLARAQANLPNIFQPGAFPPADAERALQALTAFRKEMERFQSEAGRKEFKDEFVKALKEARTEAEFLASSGLFGSRDPSVGPAALSDFLAPPSPLGPGEGAEGMMRRLEFEREAFDELETLRAELFGTSSELAMDRELAAAAERAEARLELARDLGAEMNAIIELNETERDAIEKRHADWRENVARMEQARKLAVMNTFVNAGTIVLRAMFEDNKKVAIAAAIIDTAAGVAKALGSLPYPANIAAAAHTAAIGFAQIMTIQRSNIGQSELPPGVGGAGAGSSAVAESPTPPAGPQEVHIFFENGEIFAGEDELGRRLFDIIQQQSERAGTN